MRGEVGCWYHLEYLVIITIHLLLNTANMGEVILQTEANKHNYAKIPKPPMYHEYSNSVPLLDWRSVCTSWRACQKHVLGVHVFTVSFGRFFFTKCRELSLSNGQVKLWPNMQALDIWSWSTIHAHTISCIYQQQTKIFIVLIGESILIISPESLQQECTRNHLLQACAILCNCFIWVSVFALFVYLFLYN